MTTARLRLDIVSAEREIFSGVVDMISLEGEEGEMGIAPGHSPLLTSLRPGHVSVSRAGQEDEVFYVSGGMLEVQPFIVTVLADTVVRARDIDESIAIEAKDRASKMLAEKGTEIDFARASVELAEAAARLRA